MMASATDSTITMAVAAESPPMKAIIASMSALAHIGSASTNMSGATLKLGRNRIPAIAIGTTNRFMRTRYVGKSHDARRISDSALFSTTVT